MCTILETYWRSFPILTPNLYSYLLKLQLFACRKIYAAKKLECKSSNPLVKSVTLKQMTRIVVISFVPKMLFFILLVYSTFYQKEAIF